MSQYFAVHLMTFFIVKDPVVADIWSSFIPPIAIDAFTVHSYSKYAILERFGVPVRVPSAISKLS